jgi:hypothetical protein
VDDYGGPPQKAPFLNVPAFRWGLLVTAVPMVLAAIVSAVINMPGLLLMGAVYWMTAIVAAVFLSATGHRQAASGVGAGFLIGSFALGASFLLAAGAFG